MKNTRHLALACASAILMTAAVGPAEALILQSYDPEAVAYRYTYYADAGMTEYLGEVYDSCGGGAGNHYVLHPYIPTAYYELEALYVCTDMGPYLPPDW